MTRVQESESSHDLLRGHGYEVVVHAIPRKYAACITITKPPEAREENPFEPTLVVASLSDVRRAAAATGGYLKPESAAWRFRGHVVLDGWDPEGNCSATIWMRTSDDQDEKLGVARG